MSIPSSSFAAIEDTLNRLAGESILAQVGRDDGLIPAYSLLSELAEAAEAESVLHDEILRVRAVLDRLLDNAQPFDDSSLTTLRQLVEWLPKAVEAARQGKPVVAPRVASAGPSNGPMDSAATVAQASTPVVRFDQVLELNLDENRDLLLEFHAEALDHLAYIESSLLVLDGEPENRDALNQIFRSFHTIKGVSGFLHLTPMHTLTHEVESLLDLARNGKLRLNSTIITAVLQSRDAVQTMVGQITLALEQGRLPSTIVPVDELIALVKQLAANPNAAQPAAPIASVAAPLQPVPAKPAVVQAPVESTPVPLPSASGGAGVPAASAANDGKVIPFDPAAGGKPAEKKPVVPTGEAKGTGSSSTVRVNTDKLDAMMDVVGELVIVQSQIAESARSIGNENSHLARNIAQLGRITKELQHNAMSVRLIPIKPTFQKMERLVRDLARDCEKKVNFQTSGEDTEVDRTVIEEISDPLVHMVRNSMDHGLEKPDVRVACGKPEHGTVTLKAFHQGSNIHIELSDDGKGIDHERIYAKAVEKGVIPAGAQLSRDEVLALIFAPGFSTAEKVTSVSGRGVGMDVVRRNIEKLRGKVEIDTQVGRGTIFRIKLPLTMAIIDGLVVRVGSDRFILPSTSVQMALRPAAAAITTVHGRGEVLEHRGRILPIHRLNRRFQIPGGIENPTDGIIVLVETSDRLTALLVDEMVSKQEVVIKNLGGLLSNLPGIAGGAILGDGNIALILDPTSLFAA